MDFDGRTYRSVGEPDSFPTSAETVANIISVPQNHARRIVPIILSGGAGSRLWPYSTEDTPKQFLAFTGSKNLFQLTLERVSDRQQFSSPIVVGNIRHAELCEQALGGEQDACLVLEPFARNTAVAIGMAAAVAKKMHGEDCLLLVMPSDHLIERRADFEAAVRIGHAAAEAGRLVTFGIRPTSPDTGFGYIQTGDVLPHGDGVSEVRRFIEKPPVEAAERMVADGHHLWNAGIFLFKAGVFLDELMTHAPAIGAAAGQAVSRSQALGQRIIADAETLQSCPSESVDYAVMEHSKRLAVVPMSPGWTDLGSWDALAQVLTANVDGPITALDCADCYIRSDGVQVAALGVKDLIIVASGQRLLILPRGRSQEVKKLLSAMESMAA